MKVLGKVLWGVACIMALQGTGWSSNETLSTEFVEANRHPGKLFEEPLGQRGLKELLTAFSEEEVAKMRSVPEEEPCYRARLWIGGFVREFAETKGISKGSLYNLANQIDATGPTKHLKPTLKDTVNSIEEDWKRADLEKKCGLLREGIGFAVEVGDTLEELWHGYNIENDPFYGTEDYKSLVDELDYRYTLHFLETLLHLS